MDEERFTTHTGGKPDAPGNMPAFHPCGIGAVVSLAAWF